MAYDLSLNTEHISSNLTNYEAARNSFFVFLVDDLNGIARTEYSGEELATDRDTIAQAQDILRLNVVKARVPHFTVEKHEYRRGNDVIKFAGVPTFGDGSITVDDVVGLDTKSILMAWQALTYNVNTRKGGRMADWTDSNGITHKGYKKDCTLLEYTQDYELIRSWKLYGCWVSSLDEGDFDRESDGKRQITANIYYDRAEMIMPIVEQ